MYPSINNVAFTNNATLNPVSSSNHTITSPCIFYDDSNFYTTSHTNADQTPIDVLVKGYSSDDLFYNDSKKVARERCSLKDRHRKINTVHGPRYPRMRLSLDVAKKLFGLQDMLGFDMASKTVQWLLNKSDTAIKQLITNSIRADNAKQEAVREKKVVTTRDSRNSRAFHPLEKGKRQKARERARQRTVEKRSRLGNGNYNTLAKNVHMQTEWIEI